MTYSMSGLGALLPNPEQQFCSLYNPTTLKAKQARREEMRMKMANVGIPTYPGRAWQASEQAAWNAYNVQRGLKPMTFGKYPMGQQCNTLWNDPKAVVPMRSENSFAGLAGAGLSGVFGPDCWIATGRADTLGAPLLANEQAAYTKTYGAAAAPVIAACNQSGDPRTCAGQYFLSQPFLGRPCKLEWIEWVRNKTAPVAAPVAPPAQMPPPAEDNTLLYAGGAAAVAVGLAAVFFLRKK